MEGQRALLWAGSRCWSPGPGSPCCRTGWCCGWGAVSLALGRQSGLDRIHFVAVYRVWKEPEHGRRAAQLLSIFIAFYSVFSCFLNKSSQPRTSDYTSLEMQTFVLLVMYAKEQHSPKSLYTSLVFPTVSLVKFLIAKGSKINGLESIWEYRYNYSYNNIYTLLRNTLLFPV